MNKGMKKNHQEIYIRIKEYLKKFPPSSDQFTPSWRAIPLRFSWCKEHDQNYMNSFNNNPSSIERKDIERELFYFFITGYSTFDTVFYSLYAIGSIFSQPYFPTRMKQDLRNINPQSTAKRFKSAFPDHRLTESINKIISNNLFAEWKKIRNTLIHHCTPSRKMFLGGAPQDDLWIHPDFSISLNINTTQNRFFFLSEQIEILFTEIENFISSFQ